MTTTDEIQLRDRDIYPSDAVLSSLLGDSFAAYCDLLTLLKANNLTHEWRFYDDGKAWLCKVQKQKRTIVWMSAWKGCMKATIYIPEKYKSKLRLLEIGQQTMQTIFDAKPVGKSQPCTFEIRSSQILIEFEKLIHFKVANK